MSVQNKLTSVLRIFTKFDLNFLEDACLGIQLRSHLEK